MGGKETTSLFSPPPKMTTILLKLFNIKITTEEAKLQKLNHIAAVMQNVTFKPGSF
tara:strand:+ start:219 stop:386 length:168 start_codon:yes stop_codon:yes gene_type:complete